MESKIFEVSEINSHIKNLLDSDMILSGVAVRGELSNYKVYPSGHHYFTMKDREGALRCVMFRTSAVRLRFKPENGMKVIAQGRITVFPRDGAYQLYVSSLMPDGAGDLNIAFEQLKAKLEAEGLFDEIFKKPLPRYPERIAVITSSAGAAVQDIIRVLRKRYPIAKVLLLPVRVQGEEAPAEIVGAIRYANRHKIADVIITGRGGGSIEDLWAFNDERVARAIFDSEIPIISAVGHEPDVTIADYVADLRAATPSNGAELCVPDMAELREQLSSCNARLSQAISRKLVIARRRVDELASRRALQSPGNYIDDKRMVLDHLQSRLASAMALNTNRHKTQYVSLVGKLDALSPLKVLGRGYAIALGENDRVIKSRDDVKTGDRIKVRLSEDTINCTVE